MSFHNNNDKRHNTMGRGTEEIKDAPVPRSCLIAGRPQPLAATSTAESKVDNTNCAFSSNNIIQPSQEADTTFAWSVTEENLRTLPPYFPLERTHVIVKDVQCSVIASRIANLFREESIAAKYDNDTATARAETSDHVHLTVRLFRNPNINEHKSAVLVEVQRTDGNVMTFHTVARMILRTARGAAAATSSSTTNANTNKRPSLNEPSAASLKRRKVQESEIDVAMEIAGSMLKKDRLDANQLGVESLKFLTDADSSNSDTALYVARKILTSEDGGTDDVTAIAKTIFSLIRSWRLHEDESEVVDEQGRYHRIMHSHALTVLANSLSLLDEAGELQHLLLSTHHRFGTDFLAVLVEELAEAQTRPHDSYQAARCLNIIFRSSDVVKSQAVDLGVPMAVQVSFNEGCCGHAMLARESEVMMKTLGAVSKC